MAQIAHPIADITNDGYVDEDDLSGSLFAALDEATADDTDFIRSAVSPSDDVYVCRMAEVSDPVSTENHILRVRYAKDDAGGAQIDMNLQLRQGYVSEGDPGSLIAEWDVTDISDEITQQSLVLTGEQTDAITNYADLFVRVAFNEAG